MIKTVSLKEVFEFGWDIICHEPSHVPEWAKQKVLGKLNGVPGGDDFYTPFKLGKEWLYEYAVKFQPHTGKLLMEGGAFYLLCRKHEGFSHSNGRASWYLFQDMGPYVIKIFRAMYGSNPEDDGYRPISRRRDALPEAIRLSYHTRMSGLDLPREPFTGPIPNFLLPLNLTSNWESVREYLRKLRLEKKAAPWLEERFPGITSKKTDKTGYLVYMICLDSRPTGSGLEGDVIFVNINDPSGRMYLIHDGDVEGMRLLADPVEAYDRYCEHILLRRDGRFDFLPFTAPLDR